MLCCRLLLTLLYMNNNLNTPGRMVAAGKPRWSPFAWEKERRWGRRRAVQQSDTTRCRPHSSSPSAPLRALQQCGHAALLSCCCCCRSCSSCCSFCTIPGRILSFPLTINQKANAHACKCACVCVCILVEKPNIIKIKASVVYVCVDVAAPQF